MAKSQMQLDAETLAEKIKAEGVGEIWEGSPTFRKHVSNAIGTGQYVSFWHNGRLVFMTREKIDALLYHRLLNRSSIETHGLDDPS